jgi:serine/threonine-protein kinase
MSPQSTFAHYRIVCKLGEGGMGAVYRATDTKLGRDVAIKVLPEAFAADAGRMARFEREAQVLAALNHVNIATIYGVEQGALIMELVEGADLAGPVPVETAIQYARQIAAGLEAAHEKGIVHRDLKPANIKVTPEGVVKLLDFGLARATEESPLSSSSATMSPTLSLAMTQAGMILGTAAYMSPEQARGKLVDKRADIWAFGVVLFELLTGGMLFGGETVSDSMAAVITREPDWTVLPADTPPHVRRLLVRCLRKDPRLRLRDIGEARILLDEPVEAAAAPRTQGQIAAGRRWLPWALGATAVLALALGGLLWHATRPVPRPLLRFSADLGAEAVAGLRTTAAISPDGTRLAYPVRSAAGTTMLATRLMDQTKPTILSGTENAADQFFSPDGQWIGFFADGKLRKVSIQGGAPNTLCEVAAMRGAAWGEDGNIVYGFAIGSGLWRVPASGGAPRSLSKPQDKGEATHRWPQMLPGGETILFTGHNAGSGFDDANIEVLFLKTGQTKIVQRGGYFGRYLPSGHLIFVHQRTLFAVPFDLGRYETRGMPAPILEDIAGNSVSGGGQLDFSRTGTLVYLSGKSSDVAHTLSWLDAAGKKEPLLTATSILSPRFSPDGKRLAFASGGDISVYDLARGSTTRLTVSQNASNAFPVWTPDGNHIVYSPVTGGICWVRSDGSGQPQLIYELKTGNASPGSFTPDGRRLAFHQSGGATDRDLWILPLDTADPDHPKAGVPEVFLATKGVDAEPAFSPDGRWLAYMSDESGSFHVFVRPFPEGAKGGGQAQISTTPARTPLWSRTAKELFYLTLDGHIMVVPYTVNGRSFEPGKPRPWTGSQILATGIYPPYDLAPDGKRFAVFPAAEASTGGEKVNLHMTFLLNFFDYLKQRIPVEGGK